LLSIITNLTEPPFIALVKTHWPEVYVPEQTPKPNQPSLKEEKTYTRKFSGENPVTGKSPAAEPPTGEGSGEDRTLREAHPWRQLRETPTYCS